MASKGLRKGFGNCFIPCSAAHYLLLVCCYLCYLFPPQLAAVLAHPHQWTPSGSTTSSSPTLLSWPKHPHHHWWLYLLCQCNFINVENLLTWWVMILVRVLLQWWMTTLHPYGNQTREHSHHHRYNQLAVGLLTVYGCVIVLFRHIRGRNSSRSSSKEIKYEATIF